MSDQQKTKGRKLYLFHSSFTEQKEGFNRVATIENFRVCITMMDFYYVFVSESCHVEATISPGLLYVQPYIAEIFVY